MAGDKEGPHNRFDLCFCGSVDLIKGHNGEVGITQRHLNKRVARVLEVSGGNKDLIFCGKPQRSHQ